MTLCYIVLIWEIVRRTWKRHFFLQPKQLIVGHTNIHTHYYIVLKFKNLIIVLEKTDRDRSERVSSQLYAVAHVQKQKGKDRKGGFLVYRQYVASSSYICVQHLDTTAPFCLLLIGSRDRGKIMLCSAFPVHFPCSCFNKKGGGRERWIISLRQNHQGYSSLLLPLPRFEISILIGSWSILYLNEPTPPIRGNQR